MICEIKIPVFGEQIENISIYKLLKIKGDKVNIHDEILELETDKATFMVTAEVSGFITEWLVKEGDVVKKEQVVGIIGS